MRYHFVLKFSNLFENHYEILKFSLVPWIKVTYKAKAFITFKYLLKLTKVLDKHANTLLMTHVSMCSLRCYVGSLKYYLWWWNVLRSCNDEYFFRTFHYIYMIIILIKLYINISLWQTKLHIIQNMHLWSQLNIPNDPST